MLIFAAYNYKAVSYVKLSSTSIIFLEDYGCEEESESKEAEGKEEKKAYLEHLPHTGAYFLVVYDQFSHSRCDNTVYSSCDYSLSHYSPPDWS